MKQKAPQPPADTRKFKTTISVSNTTVCEDDACIGKTADELKTSSVENASSTGNSSKQSRSSMSIGGTPACTDEACIGKQ